MVNKHFSYINICHFYNEKYINKEHHATIYLIHDNKIHVQFILISLLRLTQIDLELTVLISESKTLTAKAVPHAKG